VFIRERCAPFAADVLNDPFCAVLTAASRHSVARANAENTNAITEFLLNMKFSFLCRAAGKLLPAKWRDLRSTILVNRTNRYFNPPGPRSKPWSRKTNFANTTAQNGIFPCLFGGLVSRSWLNDSSLPISRFASAGRDSDDEYEVRFDGVENRVRKNVRQTATNIVFDYSPALRTIENARNRVFNFADKP